MNINLSTKSNSLRQNLTENNVKLIGRYFKKGLSYCFDWTNSGFEVVFVGTGIKAMLACNIADSEIQSHIQVYVDGKMHNRLVINNEQLVALCDNLNYGEHTVRVIKVTEVAQSPLIATLIEVNANEFIPQILPVKVKTSPKIEFIGDSITCGYGNLADAASCSYKTAEQDGMQTYASQTAMHFGADAHYIAISGKGIVSDCGGNRSYPLPEVFEFTTMIDKEQWDFSKWQADLVVINAGTNDVPGGVDSETFIKAALAFLKRIRECYKDAKILWCYGMMNKEMSRPIQTAVNEFNQQDGQTCYFEFDCVNIENDEIGACGHPNCKAHKKASEALINKINEFVDWKI